MWHSQQQLLFHILNQWTLWPAFWLWIFNILQQVCSESLKVETFNLILKVFGVIDFTVLVRNDIVYKSYPSTFIMPRSRSHGRDLSYKSDHGHMLSRETRPRTADADQAYGHTGHNHGQVYGDAGHRDQVYGHADKGTVHGEQAVEDNISRDSGHSSAGTPEFVKRGLIPPIQRGDSCRQLTTSLDMDFFN